MEQIRKREIKPTETQNRVGWHTYTAQTIKTHTDPTNGTQMTPAEYKALLKKQTVSKYGAKKTAYNGITYDSRKEANRAAVLEKQLAYGIIQDLQRQVSFELQEAYTNNKGEKIRAITYKADFVYTMQGRRIVEDVKGSKKTLTDAYKIKRKLFEYKYPEYYFVEFI